MLEHIHIDGFRCVRDASIALSPLTVLVGPNGSGKSTILRALNAAAGPLLGQVRDRFQHRTQPAAICYRFGDHGTVNLLEGHGFPFHWNYQLLRLDVDRLRDNNVLQQAKRLEQNGSNLANVFGTLTRKHQAEIAKHLCELVPTFQDVDVQPTANGMHELRFQDRWSGVWYTPQEISDGTILLTAYLTLPYQNPAPDILAVEEPDRGLHPYLIGKLISFLRTFALGAIAGKEVQVVLATHSAELLDHTRPEEVRFLSRDPGDGGVIVETIDTTKPDWQATYHEYRDSLGSIWLAGGLGGVPGNGAAP